MLHHVYGTSVFSLISKSSRLQIQMKKLIKSYIIAALCLPAFASCSSDFLDTTPTQSVSTATALSTTSNGYKVLNGIAKSMSTQQYAWSQGCAGENRIIAIYENYMDNDFAYTRYEPGWATLMNGTFFENYTTSYATYPWFYYYNIIGQANTVIAHIDAAEGSQADIQFIKASALTFRAYAYEKLLHYYSVRWQDSDNGTKPGVVLRLDESVGEMPRSTMAECYAQIYSDLDDAISLFGASGLDREKGKIWLPNLNVAHAVYARAALTRQDYSKALSEAKLARQGYALMDNKSYASGFCKPTSEWIMGSYGDASENNWYWSFGTQFACNGYNASNDYSGAGAISKDLTDQIPDNDARKQLFLTVDKLPSFKANSQDVNYMTYGILGLSSDEVYHECDSVVNANDSIAKANSGINFAPAYQGLFDEETSTRAFFLGAQMKFRVFDTPGVSYIPFIRSSEMVLIEAEANYFLGNTAEAQANLVELNASTGRDASYSCNKTGNDLFEEIVKYRGLELWGEGFNWSDFKRWKRDIVRHDIGHGGNFNASVAITVSANDDWTWSIPEDEITYNKAANSASKQAE